MNYFITEENLKNFENDLLNLGKKTATVTKYVSNMKTLQKYLNNQEVTTDLLQGYGACLKSRDITPEASICFLLQPTVSLNI